MRKLYNDWGEDDVVEYEITGETIKFYEIRSTDDQEHYFTIYKDDDSFFTSKEICYDKLIKSKENTVNYLKKEKDKLLQKLSKIECDIKISEEILISAKKKAAK